MSTQHDLVYCIDTSAIIDMERALRDVPDIWEPLSILADSNRLIMPEKVKEECEKNPNTKIWLNKYKCIVRPFTEELNDAIAKLQADLKADDQFLVDPGSTKDQGDPWVVALAMSENRLLGSSYHSGRVVVVCHEKRGSNLRGKVTIPNACDRYGIKCIRLRELFEHEGWRLRKS